MPLWCVLNPQLCSCFRCTLLVVLVVPTQREQRIVVSTSANLLLFCLEYVLLGFWLTLYQDEESLHHHCQQKSCSTPGLQYSLPADHQECYRSNLLFFHIFVVEKVLSTFAIENCKHKSNLFTSKILGQFVEPDAMDS